MSAFSAYQETSVLTQSRGRLVVMLYDGAIRFLKQAVTAIEENNSAEKGKLIVKAQNIIDELNNVLDMEAGGEIAQNLRKLYIFMNTRLSEANIRQDSTMVGEVISLLEELNSGWKAIIE